MAAPLLGGKSKGTQLEAARLNLSPSTLSSKKRAERLRPSLPLKFPKSNCLGGSKGRAACNIWTPFFGQKGGGKEKKTTAVSKERARRIVLIG